MTDWVWAKPGELIVDNSFSPPFQDQLVEAKSLGLVGNMRYASDPPNNAKNLTRQQAEDGWAVGIGCLMNFEQTAVDSKGGEQAGRAAARVFARQAEKIGYPKTLPAIVSHDTGLHAASIPYLAGFDDEMRRVFGWEQVGCYIFAPDGIQAAVDNNVCTDVLWQAYAGSAITGNSLEDAIQRAARKWGDSVRIEPVPGTTRTVQAIHNESHLFQRLGYVELDGGPFPPGQVDENVVLKPVRLWFPIQVDPPLPPEHDMTYAKVSVRLDNGQLAGAEFRCSFDATDTPRDLIWLTADKAARCTDPLRTITIGQAAACSVDRVPVGDHAFIASTGRDWAAFDFLNAGTVVGPPGPQGDPGAPGKDGKDGATVDQVLAAMKGKTVTSVIQ